MVVKVSAAGAVSGASDAVAVMAMNSTAAAALRGRERWRACASELIIPEGGLDGRRAVRTARRVSGKGERMAPIAGGDRGGRGAAVWTNPSETTIPRRSITTHGSGVNRSSQLMRVPLCSRQWCKSLAISLEA
ncbi:hypothetical protein GCM10011505_05590 [Tistrella bauzanensis]|uniref:Uncharacterized protein n=1 Tax=Tistrella bauzanensis TaxID=657419 RepID=A0ABQ1I8F8_9PROT|nr:hypothetical protein GCM10011505_05590 [Tistrella bauzanensis]